MAYYDGRKGSPKSFYCRRQRLQGEFVLFQDVADDIGVQQVSQHSECFAFGLVLARAFLQKVVTYRRAVQKEAVPRLFYGGDVRNVHLGGSKLVSSYLRQSIASLCRGARLPQIGRCLLS